MKQNDFKIFVCTTEPVPAIQRIMALFSRNRIALKELHVNENVKNNYFEIKIVIKSNDESIHKMIKKMEKIIELINVKLIF